MRSNEELKIVCAKASARTEQWMLDYLDKLYKNDVPGDPMTYYKWPLALHERGKEHEARKLLNWIKGHCLTKQGDFSSARSSFHQEFYSYANLWLILAAIELGEKALYTLMLDFLYAHVNKKSGGLTTNPNLLKNQTEDPLSTSFLGMAACSLKDEALASSVLNNLQQWIDQPIGHDQLWIRTLQDGSFVKQIPAGADSSTYVIALGKTDQTYYFLGSICFFLARYMEEFSDRKALGLAGQVAGILEYIGPEALHTIWAAKVAPGCTALYAATSDQRFLDIARPVIHAVLAGQSAEGYWLKNNKPWITVSAEQCYWLSTISKRL